MLYLIVLLMQISAIAGALSNQLQRIRAEVYLGGIQMQSSGEPVIAQAIEWLLGQDNPPVRYLTLSGLLGKSPDDPTTLQAKSRLMSYDVTQAILEHAEEFLGIDESRDYEKYTGKYWQLIFLGHFLADGNEPRIARAVQAVLSNRKWIDKRGGQCLTANLLAALSRLGYSEHAIVVSEKEALAQSIVERRGIDCEAMGYSLISRCYMAQPKLLLCFAMTAPAKRSQTVNAAVEILVQNLLQNEVFVYVPGNHREWQKQLAAAPKKADLPKGATVKQWIADRKETFTSEKGLGGRKTKKGWLKFGFPLRYNSDVLEALYALALLGVQMEPRLEKSLAAVRQKMTSEGTWIMENSLNGKTWADLEQKGKPSKWLTYFGLSVLAHFADLQIPAL